MEPEANSYAKMAAELSVLSDHQKFELFMRKINSLEIVTSELQ